MSYRSAAKLHVHGRITARAWSRPAGTHAAGATSPASPTPRPATLEHVPCRTGVRHAVHTAAVRVTCTSLRLPYRPRSLHLTGLALKVHTRTWAPPAPPSHPPAHPSSNASRQLANQPRGRRPLTPTAHSAGGPVRRQQPPAPAEPPYPPESACRTRCRTPRAPCAPAARQTPAGGRARDRVGREPIAREQQQE